MDDFKLMCTCGHAVAVSVTDGQSLAVQAVIWTYRSLQVCPVCAMTRIKAPQSRQRRLTLQPLSGLPYHIALAEGIRQKHLQVFRTLVREHNTGIAEDMMQSMTLLLNDLTDAGWWIQHERNTFRPLVPYCQDNIRSVVIQAAFCDSEPHAKSNAKPGARPQPELEASQA